MKKINVLLPKFRTNEILESIKECLDKGWTGMGYKTIEFETAWKEYTGLPHAHFLNSATSGLHLALNLFKNKYNWTNDSEIITTPLTFVSTNHAIMYENLKPVFADVDDSLCLDPNSVESKITPNTKAVMFVGMGGNTGQLSTIKDICKKHNLKLILDAAHMSGTKIRKSHMGVAFTIEHVGQEADATIFSFQAVKNLPTADSGMICFKDEKDDTLARQLSWLGIDKDTFSRSNDGDYKWRYDVPNIGFKYHGNSIMAAIGLVQLKYLDSDNVDRNRIARRYKELLDDRIKYIEIDKYVDVCSYHLFQIKVASNKRDDILNELYSHDIYPGVHYIDNTNYKMYAHARDTCPVAHEVSEQLITLPIHLGLTDDDIDRIINVINKEAIETI